MSRLEIPVIGIGAGPATDGQVLVFHDLLGIYDGHAPRFAKRFQDVKAQMVAGVAEYAAEVRSGAFPAPSTPTRSTTTSCAGSRRRCTSWGLCRRSVTG